MVEIPISKSGASALEIAKQTATQVGLLVVEKFRCEQTEGTFKSKGNPVTNVDHQAEELAISMLSEEFPDFSYLGEESSKGQQLTGSPTWIIDPIDGTRNFVAGIPFFSIVVGLAIDGEPVLGINYDPIRKEMFWGVKGKGAFLGQDKILVSTKNSLDSCLIGFDLSYSDNGALNSLKVIENIWPDMQTARIMGSSALGISYVAAGRLDLYFHHKLSPWDIAAGILLVNEASGVISDRHGKSADLYSNGIIASNSILHKKFLERTANLDWGAKI